MGMGPIHRYLTAAQGQQAQDQYQQQFDQSANAPIPGQQPLSFSSWHPNMNSNRSMMGGLMSEFMNGTYSPADWRGLLPQGQGNTLPPPQQNQMPMAGPYGQQAMQMAGLLPQENQGGTYPAGLLGGKMGHFRPGGK
jgi:hypothetical protein